MQLTHSEIWQGIEQLAQNQGLSLSALAVKAGLDPTSFNKSKRMGADGRKRWPSTESMNKLFQATNITIFDFMALAGCGESCAPKRCMIPLLGLVKAGRDGYFDSDGYPIGVDDWDGIEFPMMIDKKVYALEVSGDSMEPVYRDGDKLIVCPECEVRRGDRVVVKLATGEVMVKELLRETARQVELKSLNPCHQDIIVSAEDVIWMKRVVWVSQ